jgi:hypothetical protein
VRLRPGHALGQQLALQVVDQLAVFGMHGGHRAQLQAALEAGHQGVVGGHDRVLVGHEVLEAVDPAGHQLAHLLGDLLAPPGDGDVEAVVGRTLLRPATPGVEGFQQRLLRVGDDEVDDRGGAAGQPAAVPLKKSSLATVPMNGNCIWVCGSMPPGIRYWPLPSSTWQSVGASRFSPMARITPSAHNTSAR